MPNTTEKEAVRIAALADVQFEERFGDTVAPHLGAMHSAARAILRCHELAHDAVQETLIRAWTYGTLPAEPRGVLLHLVRRSSLHALRCARRRRDHESLASAHSSADACCALDPVMEIGAREELALVVAAMERLTREYRDSLDLVGRAGMSYHDAADRLGAPVGTIRSRTSRARAELRRMIPDSRSGGTPC